MLHINSYVKRHTRRGSPGRWERGGLGAKGLELHNHCKRNQATKPVTQSCLQWPSVIKNTKHRGRTEQEGGITNTLASAQFGRRTVLSTSVRVKGTVHSLEPERGARISSISAAWHQAQTPGVWLFWCQSRGSPIECHKCMSHVFCRRAQKSEWKSSSLLVVFFLQKKISSKEAED